MKNMKRFTDYLLISIKGVAMGAADVIPGVSGGTIAFLTGIYETLINSIKAFDLVAIKLFFSGKFGEFSKKINLPFLVALVAGIAFSFLSIARVMTYLMEHYPIPLWSFFFGLILASAIIILKGLSSWKMSHFLGLAAGIALGASICLLSPSQTPTDLWFIFLSGMIAICAMILPGISGSFILLLLGKYEYILNGLNEMNLSLIITFILGAAIGIVSFSHLISWLLRRFHNQTICVLAGVMLGSLLKVWPWKCIQDSGIDLPILPSINADSQIVYAIIFATIGAAIVFIIEYTASKAKKNG